MAKAKVLALRTAGTNCDKETVFAFEKAGAECELLHVNRLLADKRRLHEFDILAIPGGFSYGDDIAAGKIEANELRLGMKDEIDRFIEDGKLIIGICNGFQVLVKMGLLPNLGGGEEQEVSLAWNDSDRFEDRWVYLKATSGKCVFVDEGEIIYLPIAHAEGKFVAKDESVLENLSNSEQVVLRYCDEKGEPGPYPVNPNGSVFDIAGICDRTGRIFGLMPHPERHMFGYQHPRWTRDGLKEEGDGMRVFRNAVKYVTA
jgi:phosphoribosylformylglycinamidine synthase I